MNYILLLCAPRTLYRHLFSCLLTYEEIHKLGGDGEASEIQEWNSALPVLIEPSR